ncbi:MAG: thermonuclease family protein, partial [Rubrobacteraceae bacterium]
MILLRYPRHVYQAQTDRVVDADTVDALPLPPSRYRLLGFDAEELRGGTERTKALAIEQTTWVSEWLARHEDLIIDDRGPDPFGRRLAWIYDQHTAECLNFEFVRRWPKTATNPRYQAARILGGNPEDMR